MKLKKGKEKQEKNKNKQKGKQDVKQEKTIIKTLIVDDEQTHIMLFEAYVKMFNAGCSKFCLLTTSYNNPQKLLKSKAYRDVDLLITDYNMPNINGAELIKKIKEDPQHNKFLLDQAMITRKTKKLLMLIIS